MIVIEEKKNINETYYQKTIDVDDGRNFVSNIRIIATSITKKNHRYYLLYNSNMEVCSDAFSFVNVALANKAENTRIKALEALKFLYVFEEIVGKELADFLPADVNTLKYFLHGYSPVGTEYSFKIHGTRSNATINGYLSVYRSFLKYLGQEKHPLFATSGSFKPFYSEGNSDAAGFSEKFQTSERTARTKVEVPKYISVDQFTEILEYIRKNLTDRDEIIIRLMYQCGLRIGEVLGLTADDLVVEKQDDGDYIPLAYIRNRFTDKPYQQAKTLMAIQSRKQYETTEYNTKDVGYQFVVVPQDLFDMVNDYIEDRHYEAREKSHDRYYQKTIADRVRPSDIDEDDNYYVFINSIGTPLSKDTWNNILREIYTACNISLDSGKRKSNLNHRFRHGFAMFHVQYLNTGIVQLAREMRHSSTSSVMCYYNPTVSDQIKLKTKFAEDLYGLVPTLRRND